MHDKGATFDAITVHLDEVGDACAGHHGARLEFGFRACRPPNLKHDGAVAWGVQYHPEFSFHDIAVVIRRYGSGLVREGFFAGPGGARCLYGRSRGARTATAIKPMAWRPVSTNTVLNDVVRTTEIANWITHQVLPTYRRRT